MAEDAALVAVELRLDKRHQVKIDEVERLGDELSFDVFVQVHRFEAKSAATASAEALGAWTAALRTLHETLSGDAALVTEGLTLHVQGDGRGHLAMSGEVASVPFPSWGSAVLRFTMPQSDQALLPPVLAALDRVLSLQPTQDED